MFLKLLLGSFYCLPLYKRDVIKKTATPLFVYFSLLILSSYSLGEEVGGYLLGFLLSVATEALVLALAAIVSVKVIRLMFFEEVESVAFSFTRREGKYFIYSVGVVLLLAVPIVLMAALLLLGVFLPVIFLILLLAFLVSIWFVCRVSLVFPSVAIDRDMSFKESWELTRNNCWALIFYSISLVMIFYVPLQLVSYFLTAFPIPFVSGFFYLITYPLVEVVLTVLFSFGLGIYYVEIFNNRLMLEKNSVYDE